MADKWIGPVSAGIEKRGTGGKCGGQGGPMHGTFGGPECPQGSPQYNLAKIFKGIAAKRAQG